ncbi:MAG: efflux RND transporter periplasmic adaptor subunit [Bacteroidota bacterium]
MKKILRISLIVIVLLLFLGTIGFLYSKSRSKPEVFETEKPFYTDIIVKTVATGSIVPRNQIEVKPTVSGIIDEIFVTEGDLVEKGQIIARIRIVPNKVSLNTAQSRLKRAKIAHEEAKINFDRQKKLFEKQVIAESEYITFEIALKNAEEELSAAENNLELIRDGVSQSSGESSNTLIRSTIDGMVLEIPVEIGNSVIEANNFNAGTTIVTVADMGEMIFEGKVDESEVGKIKEGMNLILTIGAIEKESFNATLEHISPKGLEENGAIQFEIRAAIELNKDHFVRAGYSATADIVLQRKDSVLAIKESLLIFENDTTYVEVEKEDQVFEKVAIKTGISDGINIEVLQGVTDETSIIHYPQTNE